MSHKRRQALFAFLALLGLGGTFFASNTDAVEPKTSLLSSDSAECALEKQHEGPLRPERFVGCAGFLN